MNAKVCALFIISLIFIFSEGSSQTTEKSEHPLLDKYYPQPKKDTVKTVINAPFTAPEKKPASLNTPVPVASSVITAKPVIPITPPTSKPEPSILQPHAVAIEPVEISPPIPPPTAAPEISTPLSTSTVNAKNIPAINDTTSIIKPAATIVRAPVKAPDVVQPRSPAPPLYMDTRLGSSTRQYDTYEKNSYGAGSVTTSPK